VISSTIIALKENSKRKFSFTEIYFFQKWWETQSAETKKEVFDLISKGQIEFILGGWVANDEACPTYEEIIVNYMIGHEFLKKEMNVEAPKVAWLVDSFGHSAATPELMSKMGFESVVFSRVSELEKI
jgi:alpha-mannosidase